VTTEFSELYGQFAGHVLAYARRHTNRDDAEDVVAETFHVAWRRRDVVPEEPLPWLLGVAHNVLRSQWRVSRRTTPANTLERLADVAGEGTGPAATYRVDPGAGCRRGVDRARRGDRVVGTVAAEGGHSSGDPHRHGDGR